jgi:hypothetical protein
VRRIAGVSLIVFSLLAVLQTAREIALWTYGEHRFDGRSLQEQPIEFGGHRISVTDDQSTDSMPSETETRGTIQPTIDGVPLGAASIAGVRRGRRDRRDLGRYHGWYDAWVFRDRRSADSVLYLARRLQPRSSESPRFELTTVDASTRDVKQRIVTGSQLAWSFPAYRSTQFIRDGTWTVLPLALGDLLGFFPLALLVFPVGTAVVGYLLARRPRAADITQPRYNVR